MVSRRFAVTVVLLVVVASGNCFADSTGDLKTQNNELRQRIEKMEKELAELKKMVIEQSKAEKSPKSEPSPTITPKLSDEDLQKILAMVEKETINKKSVWSNLDIQLYGYLKVDAAYDTSRTTTGNYVVWVDSDTTRHNDNEFNLTANQTRLGMKITGPEDQDVVTSGRAEIDFYGKSGDENKAKIQLRHAYLKIDWPDDRFNIIAGQTSDVFSPLNPSTLNYTVLWDCGNIGYRHPQIRLTKSIALNSNVDLKLEAAVSRTIGDDELVTTAGAKSGEDSGFPTLQARGALIFPLLDYKPTTIGISGHWGKEEYDRTSTTASSEEMESWSLNLDITQPINKWLTFKGELFSGENLDNYFGGIGQGVRSTASGGITTYHNAIASKGGWIAAGLGPWDKWRFNAGFGVDDPDNEDLSAGARTLNRSVFANAIYSINKNTEIGFELSQWHTERKGAGSADDLRAQTSFIYKF